MESRRQEKGNASHTQLQRVPAQRCCSSSPITAAAVLSRGAWGAGRGGGLLPAGHPVFLPASSAFCIWPAAWWVPHSRQSWWAPLLLWAALRIRLGWQPTSQFPGKPLAAPAGQEANIFVSSGTVLREPGFSFNDTSPSSPSAGPARCSASGQHSGSRPI